MIWFQGTKRGSAGSRQETVETIIIEKVMGNLMQGGGAMIIVYLTLRYRAPWCRSLKDKRSQVRGIQAALKNKFNVSVAEFALEQITPSWRTKQRRIFVSGKERERRRSSATTSEQ
jgi:hypothetical protein